MLRTLVAVAACLTVLAIVQRVQDNDSVAATPGLTATFSGKAFRAGPDSGPPVMRRARPEPGRRHLGHRDGGQPGPGHALLLALARPCQRAARRQRAAA